MQNVLARAFAGVCSRLEAYRSENSAVYFEALDANLRRIRYATMVTMPINIVYLLVFSLAVGGDSELRLEWRQGIIFAHSCCLALMIFFHVAVRLRVSGKTAARFYVSFLMGGILVSYMATGIYIVFVDQLVLNGITPFLLSCLIVGSVFLIRPLHAVPFFTASYAVLHVCLGACGMLRAEELLSARMNGLAAAGIGLAVSIVMWSFNSLTIRQRRQIEGQSEDLRRANAELARMAFYDPLTGIPNRRHFDEIAKRELALVQRGLRSSSMVIFDIDFFKRVNDSHGHVAGDEVLKRIASLVSEAVRDGDTVCRCGGEEFIILLPGTLVEGAFVFAERVRSLIEEERILVGAAEIRVTASFGVAPLVSDSGENGSMRCYASADAALYRAKHEGRNCVRAWAPCPELAGRVQ